MKAIENMRMVVRGKVGMDIYIWESSAQSWGRSSKERGERKERAQNQAWRTRYTDSDREEEPAEETGQEPPVNEEENH